MILLGAVVVAALPGVLCLTDATTGEPLHGARVDRRGTGGATDVLVALTAAPCTVLALHDGDTLTVRRIGYRVHRALIAKEQPDTLHVAMESNAAWLQAVVRTATVADGITSEARPKQASVTVREARAMGGASASTLVSLLPFHTARSARGELSLSLRGARREQVAVTLDGVLLNDPATGAADVSDIPLALLGGASLLLGSDPMGAGSGATGGTLALRTGNGSDIAFRAGAFGERTVEGATESVGVRRRVRAGAAYSTARNDFPFVNSSTTSGASLSERRVNNDHERVALFTQLSGATWRLLALGSQQRQGMVGAVNVRDYDEDRAQSQRLLLRASAQRDATTLNAGVRLFGLAYRDPQRPAFDSDADVASIDLDAERLVRESATARIRVRGGMATDQLRTSANIRQHRSRGFVMAAVDARPRDVWHLALGTRVDAVQQHGLTPSVSVDVHRSRGRSALSARVAQAVRVPTLYDLYFASPQRLSVRALDPERVRLDAEVGVHTVLWHRGASGRGASPRSHQLELQGALSWRDVRDAIVWFPGNFGWSPANVGTERLVGAEGRLSWHAPAVTASAWATWYDSELRTGALRIPTPYVARAAGGAHLNWRRGIWHASGVWRVMGRRPYTVGPRDPGYELPGVSLVDAAIGATVTRAAVSTVMTLSVNNATNAAWQSVKGFPSPGRAVAISLVLSPKER